MTSKQTERNQRYNAERRAQAALIKRDLGRDQVLARIYQESYNRMQAQIDKFYMTYAGQNGLTKQEAMKRVADFDVAHFNQKAAEAVRNKDFSPETNAWLKTYNLKMRVSRLELLKAELALEIQNLTAEVNEVFDKARRDEQLAEFKRQAGILGNSSTGAKKRLEAILEADFYGQTFSSRVWGGTGLQATLQRDVFGSLNRIFTDMMGYKQERDRLSKKYGTSKYNAQRLLKTEIARINADTQLAMLKENDFTHMIYVAESGACKICQPLDGKAIPIDEVEKGLNMYPMHPNCRCSSYGHIEMRYKKGGSTLDREAPNGVWSEEAPPKQGHKQISGEGRKLFESTSDKEKPSSIDTDSIFEIEAVRAKELKLSKLQSGAVASIEKTNMAQAVGLANYNQFLDKFDTIKDEQFLELYQKLGHKIEYQKLKGVKAFARAHEVQLTQRSFDGQRTRDGQKYLSNPLSIVFHENGHALDTLGLKVLTKGEKVVIGEDIVRMMGQRAKVSIYAKHASSLPQYDLKNTIKRDFVEYITGQQAKENSKGIVSPKKAERERFLNEMRKLQQDEPSAMAVLSDMMEGTGWFGTRPLGWGHGKTYFKRLGSAETEFFAEVSEMIAVDPKGYEVIKGILPNAVKTYHQIVDDILGGLN